MGELLNGKCSDSVIRRLDSEGEVSILVRLFPVKGKTDLTPGPKRAAWLSSRFEEHAKDVLNLLRDHGMNARLLSLANAIATRVDQSTLVALTEHSNVQRIELDERANILHHRRTQ